MVPRCSDYIPGFFLAKHVPTKSPSITAQPWCEIMSKIFPKIVSTIFLIVVARSDAPLKRNKVLHDLHPLQVQTSFLPSSSCTRWLTRKKCDKPPLSLITPGERLHRNMRAVFTHAAQVPPFALLKPLLSLAYAHRTLWRARPHYWHCFATNGVMPAGQCGFLLVHWSFFILTKMWSFFLRTSLANSAADTITLQRIKFPSQETQPNFGEDLPSKASLGAKSN